jgi:hypothetical protein
VKCPYCREETGTGESCAKCGKKVITSKGMTVEYKDFKGAELLDIQMPRNTPSQAVGKSEPEQKKIAVPVKAAPSREKQTGYKPFIFIAAVVIILAAIAGLYLLKFLGLLN